MMGVALGVFDADVEPYNYKPTFTPELNQKIDPEIKQQWIEALLSGNYKQGKGKLRTVLPSLFSKGNKGPKAQRYCCYGVLCELNINATGEAGWMLDKSDGEFYFQDDKGATIGGAGSYTMPTDKVFDWAGFAGQRYGNRDVIYLDETDSKRFAKYYDADDEPRVSVGLAELNDRGATFKTIVYLIDKYL